MRVRSYLICFYCLFFFIVTSCGNGGGDDDSGGNNPEARCKTSEIFRDSVSGDVVNLEAEGGCILRSEFQEAGNQGCQIVFDPFYLELSTKRPDETVDDGLANLFISSEDIDFKNIELFICFPDVCVNALQGEFASRNPAENLFSLTLTDGGEGDVDGVQNGVLTALFVLASCKQQGAPNPPVMPTPTPTPVPTSSPQPTPVPTVCPVDLDEVTTVVRSLIPVLQSLIGLINILMPLLQTLATLVPLVQTLIDLLNQILQSGQNLLILLQDFLTLPPSEQCGLLPQICQLSSQLLTLVEELPSILNPLLSNPLVGSVVGLLQQLLNLVVNQLIPLLQQLVGLVC